MLYFKHTWILRDLATDEKEQKKLKSLRRNIAKKNKMYQLLVSNSVT